jgi:hypothetical protein
MQYPYMRLEIFSYGFLFTTLTLFTLNGIAQPNRPANVEFFDPETFFGDTLYIKARFMECGEWGGHLELSSVYLKGNEFYISYEVFSADCNSIKENNGEPRQTLIKTRNKKLLEKDKQLIHQYLHQLVDAKFTESTSMNAGYIFEIKNTDKSINLFVYTGRGPITHEYIQFIKHLF